jgi:hypothetical protein
MSDHTEPAANEPEPTQPQDGQAQPTDDSPLERRFARLTSRLSNVARERDELIAQVQRLQQAQTASQPTPQQQVDQQTQQLIAAEAQRLKHQDRMLDRTREFHAAGEEAYPDWKDRCQNLMSMGADPQIAELLIELPNGHRVAGALADDTEELERIAAIRTERGRALALGRYAEKLEGKPVRQQSKAPKPPTPVVARSTPRFDEYNADAQTLVQHYTREAMAKRMANQKGG